MRSGKIESVRRRDVPSTRRAALWGAAALMLLLPGTAAAQAGSLRQVGHEPLMNRGMNAAIAVHGDYAYIGSRTDGGHEDMPHGSIMVVDIADPSNPNLVAGPLDANAGESTRELRVWRSQDILIVLNTNCGVGDTLHHCTQPSISNIRFYDVAGENATDPELIRQFNVDTHEFFLWQDPADPDRALIFAGNASTTCGTRGGSPSCPFAVWDISPVRNGEPPLTLYSGLHGYSRIPPDTTLPAQVPNGGLHAVGRQRREPRLLRPAHGRVRGGRRLGLR
jgi:LVIVD repeat